MTQEDIIRMAREAGFEKIYPMLDEPNVRYAYEDWSDEIKTFAALVAAAENEACAKVCEDSVEYAGDELARQIRARGQA